MRGLTLYEPHAMLIALADRRLYPMQGEDCKRVETRPRRINYRGWLAIHAAKYLPMDPVKWVRWVRHNRRIMTALERAGFPAVSKLPRGAITCVCRLVACIEITPFNTPMEPELSFGDYRPGRWMWVLDDIKALPEPVPCTGKQGLWRVPDDIIHRMAEMGVAR